jgi:hypothetical protein
MRASSARVLRLRRRAVTRERDREERLVRQGKFRSDGRRLVKTRSFEQLAELEPDPVIAVGRACAADVAAIAKSGVLDAVL